MSVSLIDGHIDREKQTMTDNEIIKALNECLREPCGIQSFIYAVRNALDLITRQQAKIEASQMDNSQLQSDIIMANQNYEHMKGLFEQSQRVKNRAIERFLSTHKVLETARAEFERLREAKEHLEVTSSEEIHSLNAEIRTLKKTNDAYTRECNRIVSLIPKARAEAVKEFAESVDKIVTTRLKYYLEINEEKGVVYIPKFIIEKILEELKEMVGDEE